MRIAAALERAIATARRAPHVNGEVTVPRQHRLSNLHRLVDARLHVSSVIVLAALVGWCKPAFGIITTTIARVPISPAAITADPTLANYQTWDLRVIVPADQHWGYSGFDALLTTGRFYNPPFGAMTPQPGLWSVFPELRYDTFVTQAADPNNDATFIPPNITSGFPEPPAPVIFDDTHISIVFHALTGPGVPGPGTFTVARLTFRNDSIGTIVGHSADRETGTQVPFAFTIPVPEPSGAGAAIAVACALSMCLRRAS